MPDLLAQALALPGWGWLVFAAALAGLVRGFSGFGTAMIFLPFAAQVVDPVWAILILIGMDVLGPLPLLRPALQDANRPDLVRLLGFAALGVPLGVALLLVISPEIYRYLVSGLALGLVSCLLAGLRFSGQPGPRLVAGTGVAAGVSGGLAGVPGPPVILLYMAARAPVAQIRANTLLFLFCVDIMLLAVLVLAGRWATLPLLIGVALALPNSIAALIGQAVFNPAHAQLYRTVAYVIVVAAAVTGLPLWE